MQEPSANASCSHELANPVGSPTGNPAADLHEPGCSDSLVDARPIGPLTAIRRKQKAGLPLSDDEQAQVTAYYARYYRRKKGIHLKGD